MKYIKLLAIILMTGVLGCVTPENNIMTSSGYNQPPRWGQIKGNISDQIDLSVTYVSTNSLTLRIYGTNTYDDGTGFNLQNNGITLDGVADADKDIVWSSEGTPKWYAQIYRGENGDFWYLGNQEAVTIPLTVSQGGRIGINKQTDIMNYHSRFIGAGTNDMRVGGTYEGKIIRSYKIIITANGGVGLPDTYKFAYSSVDNSFITYYTNAASFECSTIASNVERGVTVRFDHIGGHTVGDYWIFGAFPQLPAGTFTVNPDMYSEILTMTNKVVEDYVDLTFQLSSFDDGDANTLLGTGTNSCLLLGSSMKRNAMFIDIDTPAQGSELVIEYWNGSLWSNVTTTVNDLYDGSSNLVQSGYITWDKSTMNDWTNNNTICNYTNLYYWLRLRSATAITLSPTAYTISPNGRYRFAIYNGKLDFGPSFYINGSGNIHAKKPLYIQGFRTNENEAVNVKYVQEAIASAQQSTYYMHSTTNIGVGGTNAYQFELYGPNSTNFYLSTNNVNQTAKLAWSWYPSNAISANVIYPSGIWNTFTYSYVNSTLAGTVCKWWLRLVIRKVDGSTQEIVTATSEAITSTSSSNPQLSQTPIITTTNISLVIGEYLGLELWTTNSSGTARTLTLVVEGNNSSRMELPINIAGSAISGNHNDLKSMQGGNDTQRYHLTSQQWANVYYTNTAPFTFGPICTNVAPNNYLICGPLSHAIIITNLILHGDGGDYVCDYFTAPFADPSDRTLIYTGATYTIGTKITNLPVSISVAAQLWLGVVITNGASITNAFPAGQCTY